jgi:hypothetical protein
VANPLDLLAAELSAAARSCCWLLGLLLRWNAQTAVQLYGDT